MFGVNGAELLVLLFVFLVVLGPKGLQQALTGFKSLVAWGRSFSQKLREESRIDLSSTGLADMNWEEFDLSQYDPREIIRQAVREEMDAWVAQAKGSGTPSSAREAYSQSSGTIQPRLDDQGSPPTSAG